MMMVMNMMIIIILIIIEQYCLANQKLCYFQMLLNIENLDIKTKNVLKNCFEYGTLIT